MFGTWPRSTRSHSVDLAIRASKARYAYHSAKRTTERKSPSLFFFEPGGRNGGMAIVPTQASDPLRPEGRSVREYVYLSKYDRPLGRLMAELTLRLSFEIHPVV